MDKYKNTIAICIPTYKREKELIRLLKSIAAQNVFPESSVFEILIVNNNLDDNLDTVFDEFHDYSMPIQAIHVKQKGLSNVRNAAISWVIDHDRDALIFVDDDEVVTPCWLDSMVTVWEKYKGDIITGPVVQILQSSAPRFVKMFHLLESDFGQHSGIRLEYANSNNTLISKNVLTTMGPSFHNALNSSGGEDNLFFHQCYLKGFSIIWDNSVQIFEPVAPERMSTTYVLKRWFHYGMNRIIITEILYPEQWRQVSLKLACEILLLVVKNFGASIVKHESRRFGHALCRVSCLAGIIVRLAGFSTANKIYNK